MDKKLTGYPSIDKPWLKYYSEEAINAPLPQCTMYEYLWESNKNHLQNTALRYYEHKISFCEMFDNIEKATKAFAAIGLKKGDIIIMAKRALIELCKKELPEYAQPVDFVFIDKMPLTPIGKIDYRKLEYKANEYIDEFILSE